MSFFKVGDKFGVSPLKAEAKSRTENSGEMVAASARSCIIINLRYAR